MPIGGGGNVGEGGIPSAGADGPPQPPRARDARQDDRAADDSDAAHAGTAHVILVVGDNGAPSLVSYARRIILRTTK